MRKKRERGARVAGKVYKRLLAEAMISLSNAKEEEGVGYFRGEARAYVFAAAVVSHQFSLGRDPYDDLEKRGLSVF